MINSHNSQNKVRLLWNIKFNILVLIKNFNSLLMRLAILNNSIKIPNIREMDIRL